MLHLNSLFAILAALVVTGIQAAPVPEDNAPGRLGPTATARATGDMHAVPVIYRRAQGNSGAKGKGYIGIEQRQDDGEGLVEFTGEEVRELERQLEDALVGRDDSVVDYPVEHVGEAQPHDADLEQREVDDVIDGVEATYVEDSDGAVDLIERDEEADSEVKDEQVKQEQDDQILPSDISLPLSSSPAAHNKRGQGADDVQVLTYTETVMSNRVQGGKTSAVPVSTQTATRTIHLAPIRVALASAGLRKPKGSD